MKFLYSLLLLSFLLLCCGFGIRRNLTDSLEHTFFLAMPAAKINRGQIVSAKHSCSSRMLAKIVEGIPGDSIEIVEDTIFINGMEKGKIYKSDQRVYEPIKSTFIPAGFYFLMGTHLKSFDSRYAEFGLVAEKDIMERLWPIF